MAEATFQKSTLREYFESILVAVVLITTRRSKG